jgi:hypothetical protein
MLNEGIDHKRDGLHMIRLWSLIVSNFCEANGSLQFDKYLDADWAVHFITAMHSYRPIGHDFGDPVPPPEPGTKSGDQNKTQTQSSSVPDNSQNITDADLARIL